MKIMKSKTRKAAIQEIFLITQFMIMEANLGYADHVGLVVGSGVAHAFDGADYDHADYGNGSDVREGFVAGRRDAEQFIALFREIFIGSALRNRLKLKALLQEIIAFL